MTILPTPPRFDRAFFIAAADWLTVGVAGALPWSTSATGIFITLWLVVALVAIDLSALKRELLTPAGGLPVLLWCLGAIGMLWADVGWQDRLAGLGGFDRLLMIPLLLAQFQRSKRGEYVIFGFFLSTAIVLIVSFALVLAHTVTAPDKLIGIPVHDDIFQNSEFIICAFGALGFALYSMHLKHWRFALGFLGIAVLFLVNLAIVVFSRIALVSVGILVLLLGWHFFRWKGLFVACGAAIVLAGVAWFASPNFRERLNESALEIHLYEASNAATSIGQHATYLRQSLSIIADAPLLGHGTGSIHEQFRRASVGETGALALATDNPHNQTFAVAIQLGMVGALVLWIMWLSHLCLFGGKSAIAWIGLVVVVENIVSSTVHSHLFDFSNGWLYVFAVGVLGGMVRAEYPPRFAGELP